MKDNCKKALAVGFDFETFQQETIKRLKAGKPLSGKDGVMTPLIE